MGLQYEGVIEVQNQVDQEVQELLDQMVFSGEEQEYRQEDNAEFIPIPELKPEDHPESPVDAVIYRVP